jgi:hypothetical protein
MLLLHSRRTVWHAFKRCTRSGLPGPQEYAGAAENPELSDRSTLGNRRAAPANLAHTISTTSRKLP